MNTFKCWAVALIAVLLLPNVAASADPVKESMRKGKACFDKEDYVGAVAAYSGAIKLDPKNAEAYFGRGEAYDFKGQYDKAMADSSEAIRLDGPGRRESRSAAPMGSL